MNWRPVGCNKDVGDAGKEVIEQSTDPGIAVSKIEIKGIFFYTKIGRQLATEINRYGVLNDATPCRIAAVQGTVVRDRCGTN
jgi:hypothetical protein